MQYRLPKAVRVPVLLIKAERATLPVLAVLEAANQKTPVIQDFWSHQVVMLVINEVTEFMSEAVLATSVI